MELSIDYDYSYLASQSQCEDIREELLQRFVNKNNKCVLMIDAALLRQRTDEQELISILSLRQVVRVPVAPQYLTEEFFPWLIELDLSSGEDMVIFEKSIQIALNEIEPQKIKSGFGRLICGWLSIYGGLEDASIHLGKTALQRRKDKDILLRYYDPAVITLCWKILDDWQRQRLLGTITDWYSIDGDGQLTHRSGLVQQYAQLTFSLSFSPETWQDIDMIAIVNLILREYRRDNISKTRLSEGQVFKTVLPALKRAWKYMFKNKMDLVDYGLHALNFSPAFDCHPEIIRLLETQCSQPGRSFRDAISSVSPKQWASIRAGDDSQPL
ncbi:DUF4123 domain-containing protein [Scandinavium sp. V105_16]|uniref:DUF4123 domain-containing protein n=1 Tax=Scandinavium lactucae TaxID=3095028 RepID=A0AAJ2VVS2_9ENTR|nr:MULTISPECIES: DUF4123 domain-containing protein [unclassified Scandinavium]MDX6018865.1 DUF4123 domain-containing protein [Scandinavium sp. V105_16]MDX6030173.1 DUF4123 domain-containing protein [Scandinavium sp. V105_12]